MENNKEVKVYKDYDIFPGKIRLVGENGGPKVMDRDVAIDLAHNKNMNLVQIAYNKNDFPKSVCKIIDYGKFLYEQKQREKEAKKKAKAAIAEIKDIVFSIRIEENDKKVKLHKIREVLTHDNDKVKISIKLSKREMNLLGMAKDLMREILDQLTDIAELDSNPSFMSGILSCTVRQIKK